MVAINYDRMSWTPNSGLTVLLARVQVSDRASGDTVASAALLDDVVVKATATELLVMASVREVTLSRPEYEDTIRKHLAKVPEVEAVYIGTDEKGTVHVYSVVREYGPFYKRLLQQERRVERECPGIPFDFHVRARQNRSPYLAVPAGVHPVLV